MQLRKAQMNRRDAMSAETEHSQPFENLSLEDDWFERRSQPLFSALLMVQLARLMVQLARGLQRFSSVFMLRDL
jgi:hypothetical protein